MCKQCFEEMKGNGHIPCVGGNVKRKASSLEKRMLRHYKKRKLGQEVTVSPFQRKAQTPGLSTVCGKGVVVRYHRSDKIWSTHSWRAWDSDLKTNYEKWLSFPALMNSLQEHASHKGSPSSFYPCAEEQKRKHRKRCLSHSLHSYNGRELPRCYQITTPVATHWGGFCVLAAPLSLPAYRRKCKASRRRPLKQKQHL